MPVKSGISLVLGLFSLAVALCREPAPDRPADLLRQAQSLVASEQWAKAEQAARQYIQAQPNAADGHSLLGFILFQRDRPKESMAEFVETAKHRDLTASELKTFALSCALLRMFPDAEKWLTRSLDLNPADPKAWEARGHLRFEQQHYADAIADFEQALRLAPKTVSAQTGIGLSNELLSRLDQAADAYKTAIAWEPVGANVDPAPLHALGRVLLKQNKPREALSYLRRAVQVGPGTPQAHEELAKAYSSLNQLGPAQTELEKAIQLAPKVARFHFALGQLYRKAGMTGKAQAELAQYEELVGTHSTPTVDPR